MNCIPGIFEKLRHTLIPFEINIFAAPPTKLKNFLSAKIDVILRDEISGVYNIPFETERDLQLEYFGMKTLNLKYRIKKH